MYHAPVKMGLERELAANGLLHNSIYSMFNNIIVNVCNTE